MKTIRAYGVKWHLKDEELAEVLPKTVFEDKERRGYSVIGYKEKKVFIKFFREKGVYASLRNKFSPRGEREYKLGDKLINMSVLTPNPLGYGLAEEGSYVIQEHIDGKTFIDKFFQSEDRVGLLNKLADLLSLLKLNKVRHNDLHLNNIIIHDGMLYIIDLHKMRIKKSFTVEDEVSNISHAITMLYDDLEEAEKKGFFERYGFTEIRSPVENEMKRMRGVWIRNKMKRAFENTSKISVAGDCLFIAGMENKAKGNNVIRLLKEDRKTRVEVYEDHVRKQYRDKRRLEKAWKNHVALLYLNMDVAPRTYYVRLPVMTSRGYIAMEDLTGSGEELDRYLDRNYDVMSESDKRNFVDRLSSFFIGLLKGWVIHRDLKACNVFVQEDGGFRLLDVEDIIFAEADERAMIKMLVQMNTTVPLRIAARDRIRFFVRLTAPFKTNRRRILDDVLKESLKTDIVYEGVAGLKIEHWK